MSRSWFPLGGREDAIRTHTCPERRDESLRCWGVGDSLPVLSLGGRCCIVGTMQRWGSSMVAGRFFVRQKSFLSDGLERAAHRADGTFLPTGGECFVLREINAQRRTVKPTILLLMRQNCRPNDSSLSFWTRKLIKPQNVNEIR